VSNLLRVMKDEAAPKELLDMFDQVKLDIV
jgi:hypothetical protein